MMVLIKILLIVNIDSICSSIYIDNGMVGFLDDKKRIILDD